MEEKICKVRSRFDLATLEKIFAELRSSWVPFGETG